MPIEASIRKSSLFVLYITGFLFSLRWAIPSYVISSFLSNLVGEKSIGYIFALSSVFTLILFYSAPRILKKLGNYKTSLIFACIGFLSLFAVGTLEGTTNIITFLIIASSTASIVSLCLD